MNSAHRWYWNRDTQEFVDSAGDECAAANVVSGAAYDVLAARLAEAERLLRMARGYVAWHSRPAPSDVKPELREIDKWLSGSATQGAREGLCGFCRKTYDWNVKPRTCCKEGEAFDKATPE